MSDPGQLAQQLLQKYFVKFGSIRQPIIYQSMPAKADYDPAFQTIENEPVEAVDALAIWDDFSFTQTTAANKQMDDQSILEVDKKVIIPALDLPGIIPVVGDRIVAASTQVWDVVGVSFDPAGAHYEFHARPFGAG